MKKITLIFHIVLLILTGSLTSCGYRIVGSSYLTFDSVTIRPVLNRTYEPRLEERLHNSLSREFLNQGIEVKASGGDVEIEATVTAFLLGAIGAVDEFVKEQELLMQVDITMTDGKTVTEFLNMESPIKITFQSAGTVQESAAHKEQATEKACREIAKEIVSRIILSYAK